MQLIAFNYVSGPKFLVSRHKKSGPDVVPGPLQSKVNESEIKVSIYCDTIMYHNNSQIAHSPVP